MAHNQNLLIIGATGNIGLRVAQQALADEGSPAKSVTLYVRNRAKLEAMLPQHLLDKAQVIEADVLDATSLHKAMASHGRCICSAGHAKQSQHFLAIFKAVVDAAKENLALPKRLWMLSGATEMDIPGAEPSLTVGQLPILRLHPYAKAHSANRAYIIEHGAGLDWSLMPRAAAPGHAG